MAITAEIVAQRPPHYIGEQPSKIPFSTYIPHALQEARIRALARPHIQRRREMFGETSRLYHLRDRMKVFVSDVVKTGPSIEFAQRAAWGVRKTQIEQTEYGKQHERALFGDNTRAHGWEHERRLYDLSEAALVQPEIRLSDSRLYLLPAQWIPTHDADQLDSEARGFGKAKWWHDGAAAVHALVNRDILQAEAGISEDTARLISGANAALMFYHDNPLIQQPLLDALERSDSRKPYEEFPAADGTLMRKYMSPAKLLENFEKDPSKVDLLSLTDWQVIGMNYLQKGKVEGFITPDSPFGLDPAFERSFSTELQTLANLPDGATYEDGFVTVRADQGEERALVPDRLLTDKLRIDIAFLGDLLRTMDEFDMTAPGLGLVRKAQVPMNKHVPFYRANALEEIQGRESKLPTEKDSYWRRSGYESYDLLLQIQRREGQLRPALEDVRWIRDYAYAAHTRNIESLMQTLPILMGGDRKAVEQEIERILNNERKAMEAKIKRSHRLSEAEKAEAITAASERVHHELAYTMDCLAEQIVPYEEAQRKAIKNEGQQLLNEANKMYATRYKPRRRTYPGTPYTTHQSTSKSSERMRTIRAHTSAASQLAA